MPRPFSRLMDGVEEMQMQQMENCRRLESRWAADESANS